jgi:coatomer subunit beta
MANDCWLLPTALILGGDFYTASVLASTLTKLVLRFASLSTDQRALNELRAESMLMMTSLIRVGLSPFASVPIDEDSVERITICLQSLSSVDTREETPIKDIFLVDTQKAYAKMVANEEKKAAEKRAKSSKTIKIQPDDLISFRQLKKKQGDDVDEV